MRPFLTIGMVAALSTALPASADAARTVAVTLGILDEGPVLIGRHVVWSETRCLTGCDSEESYGGTNEWSLLRASLGGRPVTLASRRLAYAGGGGTYSGEQISFGASSTRLVLLRTSAGSDKFAGDFGGVSVTPGPLSGRRAKLLSCGTREGADFPSPLFPFDLGGDLLAYDSAPCDGSVERPVVRDLAAGTAVALPLAPGRKIDRFAVAGDYVALATAPASGAWPDAAAVHDGRSGSLLYAAALPAGEVLHGMDLRPDGALAVVSSRTTNEPQSVFCARSSLRLYTPAEPGGRRLEARPCSSLVAQAGTRLLYTAGAGRHETLTAVDAEGASRRVLRFGKVRLKGLDADGNRVLYALRMCSGHDRLTVQRVGEPMVSPGSHRCEVSLPARRLVADRSGRVQVPLRCPRGCDGYLTISRGIRALVLEESFRLRPGRRYVRTRLGYEGRRLLRRRNELRVEVSVSVYDRAYDYRVVSRRASLRQG